MAFVSPKWDSAQNHYSIETTSDLRATMRSAINRNNVGSTVFSDTDDVHDRTVEVLHSLISEGSQNKWFTKLPSHEQLLKRVRHTFSSLGDSENNMAFLQTLLMTPKQLTLVWTPITVKESEAPPMYFEDSDGETESDVEVEDSALPPVSLTDDVKLTQEEYLLTRLRAARARVEAEQIKMQYFETTGKMPPDSDSEEDSE